MVVKALIAGNSMSFRTLRRISILPGQWSTSFPSFCTGNVVIFNSDKIGCQLKTRSGNTIEFSGGITVGNLSAYRILKIPEIIKSPVFQVRQEFITRKSRLLDRLISTLQEIKEV
ncbi:MAG: hypothetical protein H6540_04885 [Bacteroidales bacterium]|nr:hypothetical protein [Bacteroidales bacterium]